MTVSQKSLPAQHLARLSGSLMQTVKVTMCGCRWKEAYDNGAAPKVVLASTDAKALEYIPLEILQQHAA